MYLVLLCIIISIITVEYFFLGVDGSRAFVTGDFKPEGLIDDITGLGSQDYIGLRDWLDFYTKDYEYIGK
jgi:hypothetical protein